MMYDLHDLHDLHIVMFSLLETRSNKNGYLFTMYALHTAQHVLYGGKVVRLFYAPRIPIELIFCRRRRDQGP